MKHTFEGGIVATSNDGIGDEFLARMIQPDEVDVLRKRVRDYEASHRQTTLLVAALVQKAGGTVEVGDIDLMLAYDLIVYRDESKASATLKVRPRKP